VKTIIGLFDTSADAYAAQNDLLQGGIARERVSVITSQANRDYRKNLHLQTSEATEGASVGATAGALVGGAAGVLASLGLLAIPGVGLMAIGPVLAALTGAGIGAAAGGLIGGLIGLGIPEDEAELYAEGVRRGGILLTVDAIDADAQRVAAILARHNAIDIDQRATEWESAGWTRKTAPPSPPAAPDAPSSTRPPAENPVDARARGVERPDPTTGGMDPATSGIGSTRRLSSVRIYNP
jgi:hypothetical protein